MKTKAAVLHRPGSPLRIEELEVEEPGPREIGVKLVASGVCGTDLHAALGDFSLPTPLVLGHEGAGIVNQVGPGVSAVSPGDHVILSSIASCGLCDRCVSGEPYLCKWGLKTIETGTLFSGATRLRRGQERVYRLFGQGSFAGYVIVDERMAVKVPDDAPLHVAALLSCGATTGIGAVLNTAGVRPGEAVAVFGCGGVGLSAIMGAVLVGAEPIIAVDVVEWKLEVARTLGATAIVSATGADPVSAIRNLTNGGADYALVGIGGGEVMAQAYESIRAGGKVIVCGAAPRGSQLNIDPDALLQGKAIIGCAAGSTRFHVDVPRLLSLYRRGLLPLDRLISNTYSLEEIDAALDAIRRGRALKCVITLAGEGPIL